MKHSAPRLVARNALVLGARNALVLGALLAAACVSAPEAPAPRHEDIVDVLMQSAAAWNRGDLQGFMDPYEHSERVSFAGRDRFISGFQTIQEVYRSGYWGDHAAPADSLSFEIIELRPLDDEAALLLGRFRLTSRETGELSSTGLFSTVWVYTSDGWKMTHDHTTGS